MQDTRRKVDNFQMEKSTLVNHYEEELGDLTPPQLLVNCDGKAGTGRTHTILQTCRYLDFLADEHDQYMEA
jgi:hypothetical protein